MKRVCDNMLFITEERTELNVARDTSGIRKKQNVFVCISYATVLNSIPYYKPIGYIYLHLFFIQFEIFFICLISACDKGFTGNNCNVLCPFPSYGLDCQSLCNCTETSCNPVDGCTGQPTEIGIIWNSLFCQNSQCILKSSLFE